MAAEPGGFVPRMSVDRSPCGNCFTVERLVNLNMIGIGYFSELELMDNEKSAWVNWITALRTAIYFQFIRLIIISVLCTLISI